MNKLEVIKMYRTQLSGQVDLLRKDLSAQWETSTTDILG